MNLHVGQIVRCTREHFGLGPGGIYAVNEGDILLVISTSSVIQGQAIRLDDGVLLEIVVVNGILLDDAGHFSASDFSPYVEVEL